MLNLSCLIYRKRCFISNLSFKTSWQDLKDKFREVGSVVYANVTRDENGGRHSLLRIPLSLKIHVSARMSWLPTVAVQCLTRCFDVHRQVQGLGHCGV